MRNKLFRDLLITMALCTLLLWGAFAYSHDLHSTVEKIFIGFFYTAIFFFFIEDLPQKLRQRKYKKIIVKELRYTLSVIQNLVKSLNINSENLLERAQDLIKNSPEPILIHDVHRSEIYSQAHKLETINYKSIGDYLSFTQKKIKQVKRRLEKFTFVVDTELLDMIIEIEKFQLSWMSEILKEKTHPQMEPGDIIPDLWVILDLEERITKYLKRYRIKG